MTCGGSWWGAWAIVVGRVGLWVSPGWWQGCEVGLVGRDRGYSWCKVTLDGGERRTVIVVGRVG